MKTNLSAIYHHPEIQSLQQSLGRQDHRTLVLWALETGQEILTVFTQTFPEDPRPSLALQAAEAWSRGEIKMPMAKRAAKETHEAAKDAKATKGTLDIDDSKISAAVAAAHAMGQVIGVVHVGTHSTAYAAYAVQALVLLNTENDPETILAEAVNHLSNRLSYWASSYKENQPWASFL
jgi:hypothetical protein